LLLPTSALSPLSGEGDASSVSGWNGGVGAWERTASPPSPLNGERAGVGSRSSPTRHQRLSPRGFDFPHHLRIGLWLGGNDFAAHVMLVSFELIARTRAFDFGQHRADVRAVTACDRARALWGKFPGLAGFLETFAGPNELCRVGDVLFGVDL